MHATLTVAEIRCDHCLAPLPAQIGENAVLARIRAAQNGWLTVSYGATRIMIAKKADRNWKIYLPASAEFCPACEPLSTEQWFLLCQKRLVDRQPPFQSRSYLYDDWSKFELLEYEPSAPQTARPVGQLGLAGADRLVRRGTCTWDCLLAAEKTCTCRCGGEYHGAAIDAFTEVRKVIEVPS